MRLDFCCGSTPVLADLAQQRRLSEVERTSRPRKQTLPLEDRLSGVEPTESARKPTLRLEDPLSAVLPENLIRVRFGPICSLYYAGMWHARSQDALIVRDTAVMRKSFARIGVRLAHGEAPDQRRVGVLDGKVRRIGSDQAASRW